jgi:hypothetical protein
MASRISVLIVAAGLGLAGGAVLLETLPTASSGPSGRVRPTGVRSSGPPPFTEEACDLEVPASDSPGEEVGDPEPPASVDAEPEDANPPARVKPTLCGVVLDVDGNPVPGAVLEGPPRTRH